MNRSTLLAIAAVATGAWLARAQNPPIGLQITSPSTGTVVHPGDQISVSVSPMVTTGFLPQAQQVFLAGEGMGISAIKTAPFEFTYQIPPSTSLGEHNLYAAELTTRLEAGGQSAGTISAISYPITLQVVPTAAPWQIVVEPAALSLQIYPGSDPSASAQRLHLYFQYQDGTLAPVSPIAGPNTFQVVTESSGVISVDNTGLVTPQAAGVDHIQITCYSCGNSSVPPIPVVVQKIPIHVNQRSIMVSAAGGTIGVSVITDGTSYKVSGESWTRAVNSVSSDKTHWTTTVAVSANTSSNPRVGTLQFSLATGENQDVVIYQAGPK